MKNNTRNKEAITELERLTNGIGTIDEDTLVHEFLAVNDKKDISPILQSFALDAMLIAENDFDGEFKNINELKKRFLEIKKELG